MKKILSIILLGLILLPFNVSAATKSYNGKEYKTMNLDEALTQEGIEHNFSNYKETDDQITIYLFRGNGCGFCKKFLTFLNNNIEEYGKYFKVVSFEVWKDSANNKLMKEVADFLDADAGGVPFVIIGDKYFPGYSSEWDEDIKSAIKEEYEKSNRYDVFEEIAKAAKEGKTESNIDAKKLVLWNFAFMVVGTAMALTYMNYKIQPLNNKIDELKEEIVKLKKAEKKEVKKAPSKKDK